MNERIRELAEQADINIDSFQFSGTPIKYIVGESSLEKFAELIVKECANELLKWRREPFPLDAESAARIIKQHFGVN